jgi:hypothetical protein
MLNSRGGKIGLLVVAIVCVALAGYFYLKSSDSRSPSKPVATGKPAPTSKPPKGLSGNVQNLGLRKADASFVVATSAKLRLNEETVSDYFDAQVNDFDADPKLATAGFIALISNTEGRKTFEDPSPAEIDWVNVTESKDTKQAMIVKLDDAGISREDGQAIAVTTVEKKLNPDTVADYFTVQTTGFDNTPEVTIAAFNRIVSKPPGLETFQRQSPVLIDWIDAKQPAS